MIEFMDLALYSGLMLLGIGIFFVALGAVIVLQETEKLRRNKSLLTLLKGWLVLAFFWLAFLGAAKLLMG